MRFFIFLFVLIGIDAQAQELTRISDLQKNLLAYDDQSFFEIEDNTYEYHISGRHVLVTEIGSSTAIYKSRTTLCDENFRVIFYYRGNIIFVGMKGLYIEGIFNGEDQYIDYGDFEAEDPYGYNLNNNIFHLSNIDDEYTLDLDALEVVEYRRYILTTENSYYYKSDDQLVRENKITKDTVVLASSVATFSSTSTSVHPLGDKILINIQGQKSIVIDDQDLVVAELPELPYVNELLQPLNADFFVVLTNHMNFQIHYFDKITYELLNQFTPSLDQITFLRFGGSSSSGIYLHDTGFSTFDLYYWDYELNELQAIIHTSPSEPLQVDRWVESNEHYAIQSLSDIIIVDKSDNSINRLLNAHKRFANLGDIEFVKVNGEDKLLVADTEGYKYYQISSELELVEPVRLLLEDGLGEDIVKNENIYLLSDKARGLDEIEYLYGDPLELKSFEAPGIISSDVIVSDNKIYYLNEKDNVFSLLVFDPELGQSILLRDELSAGRELRQIGQYLLYSMTEVYDLNNDQVIDLDLSNYNNLRSHTAVTDRYIYRSTVSRTNRMLINDINNVELVFEGRSTLGVSIDNGTFVLGSDDGVYLEEESGNQIIPYPNGFTKESLRAKDNLIVLVDYDQEENTTEGFFLDLNDYSWKPYSLPNQFYDITGNLVIGAIRELDTWDFSIYNTITEEYKETILPSFPTILGSKDDKFYVHVYNENSIRVYNFSLELQDEIALPPLDGTLGVRSSDDYNHILLIDPIFKDEEYNLVDYHILNTDLDEVITFDNCFGDVQLVDLVSFDETVEFIGYTESLGNQLYTYELENFTSTDVIENQSTPTVELTAGPNPTSGMLILDKVLEELIVISIEGRIVLKARNTDTIDLSILKKGIYILQGTVDDKLISQKIIRG